MYKTFFNLKLFKIVIVLSLILLTQLFSNIILIKNNLYYILPWLDIPMHIWGGFLFGSLFIFCSDFKNSKSSWVLILLFVFIIGFVWEVYEYIHDIYYVVQWGGWLDTIKDLCDDLIGGAIAYFLFAKNKMDLQ